MELYKEGEFRKMKDHQKNLIHWVNLSQVKMCTVILDVGKNIFSCKKKILLQKGDLNLKTQLVVSRKKK